MDGVVVSSTLKAAQKGKGGMETPQMQLECYFCASVSWLHQGLQQDLQQEKVLLFLQRSFPASVGQAAPPAG